MTDVIDDDLDDFFARPRPVVPVARTIPSTKGGSARSARQEPKPRAKRASQAGGRTGRSSSSGTDRSAGEQRQPKGAGRRPVPSRPAPQDRAGREGTGPTTRSPRPNADIGRAATARTTPTARQARGSRVPSPARATSRPESSRLAPTRARGTSRVGQQSAAESRSGLRAGLAGLLGLSGPNRRVLPRPTFGTRHPQPVVALDGAASRRLTLRRLTWLVVMVVAMAGAIGAKLATVQIAQRDRWQAWGLDQRDGWRVIPAGRGAIMDRNGQPLAMSVVRPDVVADPLNVEDPAATAATLAPILGRSRAELTSLLDRDGRYSLLAKAVDPEVAEEINELRQAQDRKARSTGDDDVRTLAGIDLVDRLVRQYPVGNLATSIVGRTVVDGGVDTSGREGVSGIEEQFDDILTGEPGRLQYEHDPNGRTIAGGTQTIDPARPGTNVYLTIDQALQYESERAIADQVEATGAAGGMVLIMRPSTGEILAMASVAPNAEGEAVNTRDNRSVTAVYEPGSVNKVITVAGAMEEGLVEADTILQVPDHLTIYDKTFRDHDPHPVRSWSVTDILVTSSNIGTIKLAQELGRDKVDSYLRDFGLGSSTGLGFPNEENGIMLDLDDWSGTSIGAIPIGQGIAVTSLQMLSAYNAIANDGVYVAPRLVAATDPGTGRVDASPSDRRRVISVETAQAVQQMLEKVVTDGTGKRARIADYPAAGKTGTARIPQGVDPSDGYLGRDGRYHYQSTFLGFVTGADLSVLVTLEDPQTSTYGGEVAAPVFSQLAAVALLRSQTPPPALLERSATTVPELSATARSGRDEDAGSVTTTKPEG